tara:strand:+ start:82 stop:393 length:312 start_codon:yes stop_codon:yes gene_type:complete
MNKRIGFFHFSAVTARMGTNEAHPEPLAIRASPWGGRRAGGLVVLVRYLLAVPHFDGTPAKREELGLFWGESDQERPLGIGLPHRGAHIVSEFYWDAFGLGFL